MIESILKLLLLGFGVFICAAVVKGCLAATSDESGCTGECDKCSFPPCRTNKKTFGEENE